MIKVNLKNFTISNDQPFVLIAGPCVIEDEKHSLLMAEKINNICQKLNINYVYKSSFDKANRSSIKSLRGVDIKEGIRIFDKIKNLFNCPITTDVHNEKQCEIISQSDVVDIIQIPAFLCRQTDLLIAAAKTNKIINIKKGQFLSPYDMPNIIEKIISTNNEKIILTERGVSFGYNNLVSDFRSLEIMKKLEYPVVFDATHSVQEPGGLGNKSGGKREFIPVLSKAAVSVGIAGLFIETHDDPDNAPSDGLNMIHINNLKPLLKKLIELDKVTKS